MKGTIIQNEFILLRGSKQPNFDYFFHSALDWSIKIENQQFLGKLLEIIHKCRLQKVLRFTNEYNENCLHTACLNDRSDRIRLLLKYGRL